MPTVAVVLVALIVASLAASPFVLRRLGTRRLRARFGPEYDRTVRSHRGDVAAAERELAERVALHRKLRLTALPPADRTAAEDELRRLQGAFVDDPVRAAADAERLLQSLLDRVGYPAEGRLPALSVDHADLLAEYRTARGTLDRARTAGADTEELRTALLTTRALARAVLDRDPGPARRAPGPKHPPAAVPAEQSSDEPAAAHEPAVRTPAARHG
ncbi:hypothetical protein [Kitasatospora sp. NPDC059571]|uniref:hypothetical protein n=1 Tax=Kitasatospora sp. NPDC059571 TaxID=3346871 RepID=UPI00367B1B2B